MIAKHAGEWMGFLRGAAGSIRVTYTTFGILKSQEKIGEILV